TTAAAATAAAIATAASAAAFTARASLVDGEGAAAQLGLVLLRNRRVDLVGIHVDKAEASAFYNAGLGCAISAEMTDQILLRGGVRKVAYIKGFGCQMLGLL